MAETHSAGNLTDGAGIPAERTADLACYPTPPIPAYVDLRHYKDMPLEVQTLLDSTIAGVGDAEIFRCGVLIWCKSWQQVPCGSLEDDDGTLARACGLGRDLKSWSKLKPFVMRGFRVASDGRLYHWMVCKKAAEAWNKTSVWQWGKQCDALRKVNKGRKDAGQEPLPMPDKPVEISCGWDKNGPLVSAGTRAKPPLNSGGSPPAPAAQSGGGSAGNPAENALKGREGNRKGREEEGNLSKDSVAAAPAEPQGQPVGPIFGPPAKLFDDDEIAMPLAFDRSPEAQAVQFWNEAAKELNAELDRVEWAEVQKLTTARRKAVKARLADAARLASTTPIEGFKIALAKAKADPWARGETRRPAEHANWRFNFDYFVKEKSFTQIMEKPDDDDPSRRQQGRTATSGHDARVAGILEARPSR